MRYLSFVAVATVLLTIPQTVSAQQDEEEPASGLSIQGTLVVGFENSSSLSSPAGGGFSIDAALTRTWALKLEVFQRESAGLDTCARNGFQYSCKDTEQARLVGVAYSGPELRMLRPYAEALGGRYSAGVLSGPSFPVAALGAGVDVRGSTFTYRIGLRHFRAVAGDEHVGFAAGEPLRYTMGTVGLRFSFGQIP